MWVHLNGSPGVQRQSWIYHLIFGILLDSLFWSWLLLFFSFLKKKKKRILSAVVTLIIMLVSLLILLIPHSVFKLILFWIPDLCVLVPAEHFCHFRLHFFLSFLFFFCLFAFSRAAPMVYGGSQARGLIGAAATGQRQSHSNAGSEPRLQPTPQLTAMPDP